MLSPALLGGCVTGSLAENGRTGWAKDTLEQSHASSSLIRVRILRTRSAVRISAPGPVEFQSIRGDRSFSTSASFSVRGGRHLTVATRTFASDVILRPKNPDEALRVNGRRYRGFLQLHRGKGGILEIVEHVNLEQYLYGVLPKEVGAAWPTEALKVQAVISRTYVLANRTTDTQQLYDVSNDVMSQVYGGMDSELVDASKAVENTRGQILLNLDGKPLEAFFHAACGGHTDLPEAVWPSRVSNASFSSVPDTFCSDYPRHQWSTEVSLSVLLKRLRRAGIHLRDLKSVAIGNKMDSGRAETIVVKTSRGTVHVQGNRFRLAAGPEVVRSLMLTSVESGRKTVRFEGRGWGHGVGVCQWGARGRALAGQKYDEILRSYFPKAKLTSVSS